MLCALYTDAVVRETANRAEIGVSAAADSKEGTRSGVLKRQKRRIVLETRGEVLGGLRVEVVVLETANEARIGCQRLLTVGKWASGGAPDGCEGGIRLQEVSDDICAHHLQLVVAQTASKGAFRVSAAADTFMSGK